MSNRLDKRARRKYQKMVEDNCAAAYGQGPRSAWAHMSERQRSDAQLAQAASLVLMQSDSTGERLSFADAQDMLRACISEVDAS